MNIESTWAFTAIAALIIATPGPAVLLALRNGMTWGVAAAIWSSLGNITGVFCVSAAVMLGLGWVLQTSEMLFASLKTLGAVYFIWVGCCCLRGGAQPAQALRQHCRCRITRRPQHLYGEAMLVALLNPTPVLFSLHCFPSSSARRSPCGRSSIGSPALIWPCLLARWWDMPCWDACFDPGWIVRVWRMG